MTEKNETETDKLDSEDPDYGNVDWALRSQKSFEYDNDLPLYDAWLTLAAEVRRLREAGKGLCSNCGFACSIVDETERLQAVVADQALTIGTLKDELQRERMRLAGCGVAALGYFNGCMPEYESASLHDTVRLYAEKERLRLALEDERSLTAAAAQHTAALER